MTTISTARANNMHPDELMKFVNSRIDPTVTELIPLKGGEYANAYEMVRPDGARILRTGPQLGNFQKDRTAAVVFASDTLKIPRVLDLGSCPEEAKFYAVSEKAFGERFCDMKLEEKRAALPSVIKALVAIHAQPLPEDAGFGRWEYDSVPQFSSWRDFILSGNIPVGYTYAEQRLIDKAIKIMDTGSSFSLNTPCLVHGDFGNDNLIVSDGEVSGVIDWGESTYGDPVYDIAWLELWDNSIPVLSAYEEHGGDMSMLGKHVKERVLASQCCAGLSALWYYQFSKQVEKAEWILERLNYLL